MSDNKEKKETIKNVYVNPDGAVNRGYLKENIRIFSLNNTEKDDIPPHYHEFHKVIFFSGGNLEYVIEGNCFRLLPGDVLIIPAFHIHQPMIGSKKPYRRTVIWIKTAAAEAMGIESVFSEPGILGRKAVMAPVDPVISSIIAFINDNLSEDLSIERICEKFYISRARMISRFKEVTGTTPHQYIIQKRIVLAARLLEEKKDTASVCAESGFRDYSSFYRAFVKEYGISPGAY